MSACDWRYREGVQLSLVSGEQTLACYHFATDPKKPFVHPLRTNLGTQLTCLEPSDHVWHRGLWFAWKFLDGVNYWEEGFESAGSVELSGREQVSFEAGRAVVQSAYGYRPPDGDPVLHERRTVAIHAPDSEDYLRLDWAHVFEATNGGVVIDRTPINEETPWGGYAGLSFRAARSLTSFRAIDSEGRTGAAVEHARARWVDLSGAADGGFDRAAGLAIFDHPANERHPSHWRCILEPGFGYINPSFVLAEPYVLDPGRMLRLRYRVLIHDGWPNTEELEREAQHFASDE